MDNEFSILDMYVFCVFVFCLHRLKSPQSSKHMLMWTRTRTRVRERFTLFIYYLSSVYNKLNHSHNKLPLFYWFYFQSHYIIHIICEMRTCVYICVCYPFSHCSLSELESALFVFQFHYFAYKHINYLLIVLLPIMAYGWNHTLQTNGLYNSIQSYKICFAHSNTIQMHKM